MFHVKKNGYCPRCILVVKVYNTMANFGTSCIHRYNIVQMHEMQFESDMSWQVYKSMIIQLWRACWTNRLHDWLPYKNMGHPGSKNLKANTSARTLKQKKLTKIRDWNEKNILVWNDKQLIHTRCVYFSWVCSNLRWTVSDADDMTIYLDSEEWLKIPTSGYYAALLVEFQIEFYFEYESYL